MNKWMIVLTLGIIVSIVGIIMTDIQTPNSPAQSFVNIQASELEDVRSRSDVTILDVRTQEEYDAGHLPDAELLDFYSPTFAEDLEGLDKDKTYLVYCRSGNRSSQAMQMMKEAGFADVYNLSGGMLSLNSSLLCTGNC